MQDSNSLGESPRFRYRISRNLILGLVSLITLVLSASYSIIWLEGRPSLQALHFKNQLQLGQNVLLGLELEVSELRGVIRSVASSISVGNDVDVELIASEVLPALLTSPNLPSGLVSGGILLEPQEENDSASYVHYLWRRDQSGEVISTKETKLKSSEAFLDQTWYMPSLILGQEVYWSSSRAYKNTGQSIATLSAPIQKGDSILGVASIDVELKRIGELLIQLIAGREGYAFVVDRNNRFIVFPTLGFDVSRTTMYSSNHAFEYVDDLAREYPAFSVISEEMEKIDRNIFTEMTSNFPDYMRLVERLETDGRHIGPFEARRIVSNSWLLARNKSALPNPVGSFEVREDMILRSDANAIVYQMPSTGWRVVTVFEGKAFGAISDLISQKLFVSILLSSVIFGLFALVFMKIAVIDRMTRMITSLTSAVQNQHSKGLSLDYEQRDELGLLAYWFNKHANQMENAILSARRADRAKSDFLAAMAKEMRTPINSILGFSRRLIVKLGGNLGDKNYQTLVGIQRSATHLLSLVDDIVEISELESDRVHLKFDWQSVNMVLDDVSSQMAGQLADANLSFEVLALREDVRVYADRQKIIQILLHLLVNALQSTESGGVILKAATTMLADDEAVSFSVTDSSAGLSNKEKHLIYRQFSQVEDHTEIDAGLGPGLYLIREITALHSGAVFLESVIGVGTTFEVVIPISANLKSHDEIDKLT
ncbi:MAG: hypothetical protein K6L76_02810 [Agarilytica sp.]